MSYFFIKSKLDGNVIDTQRASTKGGALLDSFPQKTTGTDNQLWEQPTSQADFTKLKMTSETRVPVQIFLSVRFCLARRLCGF